MLRCKWGHREMKREGIKRDTDILLMLSSTSEHALTKAEGKKTHNKLCKAFKKQEILASTYTHDENGLGGDLEPNKPNMKFLSRKLHS